MRSVDFRLSNGMIMNGIKLVLLFLQVLHIHCSVEELRSLSDCGWSPFYPKPQIAGGYIIEPDEFSWMASLEYGSRGFGYCAGSVISSRYVLTAAHCVTGEQVENYGGLTGVRLGNLTQRPFCDYGTSQCNSYLRFGIANITVHENYHKDSNQTIRNDIALLRLDSPIQFGPHMGRVCLPFNSTEPTIGTQLTVAGWGLTTDYTNSTEKRAVGVPLLDKSNCEHQDQSLMCAAKLADTDSESKKTCEGDSGGPLMHALNQRQMVIEGIVSYGQSTCGNRFFPTHFTRVRHYLSWIEKNVCMGSDCASVVERKFPSDCGYTPMYPKEQTDGPHLIRPDEYSWFARLVYGNTLDCVGSVINSRYVLTSVYCATGEAVKYLGALTGVRLGDYDEQGHKCDYGIVNCTHYQQFGIEKKILHRRYRHTSDKLINNIALIRLDRSIQFGAKMKPICLPFGIYGIPEPPVNSSLTLTGWYNMEDNSFAKRDASVTLWKQEKCKNVFPVDGTHICTANECISESGSPLMFYQSPSHRMVLEGMLSYRSANCTNIRIPVVYTRVRSYLDWLNQNMEM